MEEELNKVYYKISEAANFIGEPVTLVRFWSDTFPELLKPRRNKKGNRQFTPEDIRTLRALHYLIKERGMTLEGARKAIKGKAADISTQVLLLDKLKSIRAQLVEIKENM